MSRSVMGLISPMKLGKSRWILDLRGREAARMGAAQGQAGAFLIYTKKDAQ